MASQHYHIPGFEEAIAQERALRTEVYLNAPRNICGVLVNQITPRLQGALICAGSPFLCGGKVSQADVLGFLWICSPDFSAETSARDAFLEKSLAIDCEISAEKIDQFLEDTYMDAPVGRPSMPYYSSQASLEFTMAGEPFRWDYDAKTQHVPLRRIYQLMRCMRARSNQMLSNPLSDGVRQKFLDELYLEQKEAKGRN